MKRIISVLLTAMLALALLIGTGATALAADAALTVSDGAITKTYSLEQLTAMADGREYDYSAVNTFCSFKTVLGASGPAVADILADAGIVLDDDDVLQFTADDGYTVKITAEHFLEPRFYFPNGAKNPPKGAPVTAEALEGAVQVPVIINMSDGRLCIGQAAPTEQTFVDFATGIAPGGSITVLHDAEREYNKVTEVSPLTGAKPGDEITITRPEGAQLARIYYTTDGSTPTVRSQIYDYKTKNGNEYMKPVVPESGRMTLKTIVIGREGEESDVSTFAINQAPAPQGFELENISVYGIKCEWEEIPGAQSYQIARLAKGTSQWKYFSATDDEYIDTSVTPGTYYYYRLRAMKNGSYGAFTGSLYTRARPEAVDDLELRAKRASGASPYIQIKWDAAPYATRYRVMRFEAGAWKGVALPSGTVWTDKNVKPGRVYMYRVQAYTTVGGTNIFGCFSDRLDIRL